MLVTYKNEETALLEMRMFIMQYLKGLNGSKEVKVKVCSAKNKKELFDILDEYEKDCLF